MSMRPPRIQSNFCRVTRVSDRDNWVDRLRSAADIRDAAIDELRRILVRGLQRSFAARGGGEAFAEDVAHEALLRILDSLDSFAGRSRFTTWAMTIAVRVGVSELRHKRFQDVSLQQITGGENLIIDVRTDSAGSSEQQERRAFVIATLKQLVEQRLTEKQRTVVQADLGGMPIEEIARRLGTNRNAVYKMFHDARQKLRQGFEAAGISAEDVQAALG
jgi:RNA polymerase sigma factor (sigma-70 family)